MKKLRFLMILLLCVIVFSSNVMADELEVTSPYFGVYNASNLEMLIGSNTDEKISIASITKLMSAVVFVDNVENLEQKVTINYSNIASILDSELSVAGIYDSQELTYYDLLATMLIPSGADSALYISVITFDSYDTFISKMNEKAQEIGMLSTHFSNPTGLDDDENYSTIEDVAKLMQYVLSNETLKEIISMDSYTTSDGNLSVTSTISKTCQIYDLDISYIKGGKTGTTENAGICLASYSQDEDGTILITVATGASMYSGTPYNLTDTEELDKYIQEKYSIKNVVSKNDVVLKLSTYLTKEDEVLFYSKEDVTDYIENFDESKLKIEYEGVEELTYKNIVGESLGEIKIYYDDELLTTQEIILENELHFSIIKWIKVYSKEITAVCLALISILVIVLVVRKSKNKHKKRSK